MLVFCLLAPLLDVASKLATADIPVGQITAARFIVQGALMVPVMVMMRIEWTLSKRIVKYVALRAFLLILSTYCFVMAVTVMPIADALAIAFVEPFILLWLGKALFKDEVGPRRIGASVVGFCGALLVIQPSLNAFGLVALFPLGTAFAFAAYMLTTREMAGYMHPVAMQQHTSLMGIVMCLPIMLFANGTGWAEFDPVMPQGLNWLWLFGVGFWAAISHMSMTYALKYAPSATLAPLHYFEIVAAVGLGYAVFGDFPNMMTWGGIGVIVASGLYIIYRERLAAQQLH